MPTLVQQIRQTLTREGMTGPLAMETPTFDTNGNRIGASRTQTVEATSADNVKLRPHVSTEFIDAAFVVKVAALDLVWVPAIGDVCTWAGLGPAAITGMQPTVGSGQVSGYLLACGR